MGPQPPPPSDGFDRITLEPGSGFIFNPPGRANTGFNIFWDGNRLTGSDGARFADPESADDAGKVGPAPDEGYVTSAIAPAPDMVLHVRVTEDGETKTYTLWIPPPQDLGGQPGPLTFDWRPAELTPPPPAGPLPQAFEEVHFVDQFFQGGADVAGTNLLVTMGLLLLLLAGASLFNEALEENIRGFGVRSVPLPGPLGAGMNWLGDAWRSIAAFWAAIIPGRTWLDRAIGPAALLLGTGFIYSLLEPGVGWNERSFTLFVSLVISQGVLVLFYEGGKAWLYRRTLRVDAGMRLFPACIIIALVSVLISRAAGFHPGIVIGFVAAAVVLGEGDFTQEERGRSWALIAAFMLAISVLAWIAAIPLHELYKASPNVWTGLPEAVAISVFVVCLEGLLFSLIPLEFMDGWRIWKYSPVAWVALFVPSTFLFIQILFNDDEAYLDLVSSQKSITGLIILVGYLGVTFGTWAFFRWRIDKKPKVAESGETPGG